MGNVAVWVWCGAVVIMGLLGLFVASNATSPVAYWGGLGFFVVAVLFVMHQVKLAFDHGETQAHSRD